MGLIAIHFKIKRMNKLAFILMLHRPHGYWLAENLFFVDDLFINTV